jgi:hypothetical protein
VYLATLRPSIIDDGSTYTGTDATAFAGIYLFLQTLYVAPRQSTRWEVFFCEQSGTLWKLWWSIGARFLLCQRINIKKSQRILIDIRKSIHLGPQPNRITRNVPPCLRIIVSIPIVVEPRFAIVVLAREAKAYIGICVVFVRILLRFDPAKGIALPTPHDCLRVIGGKAGGYSVDAGVGRTEELASESPLLIVESHLGNTITEGLTGDEAIGAVSDVLSEGRALTFHCRCDPRNVPNRIPRVADDTPVGVDHSEYAIPRVIAIRRCVIEAELGVYLFDYVAVRIVVEAGRTTFILQGAETTDAVGTDVIGESDIFHRPQIVNRRYACAPEPNTGDGLEVRCPDVRAHAPGNWTTDSRRDAPQYRRAPD